MKKFIAVSFAVTCITLAVACGSNGPTVSGPDPVTVSAPEPTSVAPVAVTPKSVVPGTGAFSVTYFQNAGFQVTNLSGESKNYYAYYTSFDNQTTALGVINGLYTKNGKDFTGSFNKTCVQLDLTEEATVVGGPGGRAFAYAYFDKQGKEISNANRAEKIAECRTPDPQPTPEPSPSPSPEPRCVASWQFNEQLDTTVVTVGDYGQCQENGKKQATETTTKTQYEQNSCTQETRVREGWPHVTTKPLFADCACSDYTAPTITIAGGITVVVNGNTYKVEETVTPNGGTFSPTLPNNADVTNAVQTFSTVYTVSQNYGPGSLHCSVTATKPFSADVAAGGCFYNVKAAHDADGKTTCLATPGVISWNDQNNLCQLTFPGIVSSDFNLNGGQSIAGCLKKNN